MSAVVGYLLGGAVLGQVMPRVLASDTAKRCYVKGLAAGMRAKSAYLDLVEQARAEVGDMVAEATFINTKEADQTETA